MNGSTLAKEAEIRNRANKARKAGYKPGDEFYYSIPALRKLLPYALDPEATAPATVADSGEINRHHAGKAEGHGGWEAAIADVRRALTLLPPRERRVVTLAYRGGVPSYLIAERMGLSADEVVSILVRAVGQLQRSLGGQSPY